MEELLNKLIERGWKPFGDEKIEDAKTARWNKNLLNEEVNKVSKFKDKVAFTNGVLIFDEINLRELVSKESGLWQFVCENRKYGYTIPECWIKNPKLCNEGIESVEKECNQNYYEYYIIESALCDEDKLEKFLLDNIKIDE